MFLGHNDRLARQHSVNRVAQRPSALVIAGKGWQLEQHVLDSLARLAIKPTWQGEHVLAALLVYLVKLLCFQYI
ncbi:hypothetical protein N9995_00105 [bacterium]|nr:hypothetical protein [bacterium]